MLQVKPIISKPFSGQILVIDRYISFFGEVDSESSIYKPFNIPVSGKVLVFRGSRGSTVGSYVIYGLKKKGLEPTAMLVKELDTVLIAGCVLADIPLLIVYDYDNLVKTIGREARNEFKAYYKGGEYIYVEEQ